MPMLGRKSGPLNSGHLGACAEGAPLRNKVSCTLGGQEQPPPLLTQTEGKHLPSNRLKLRTKSVFNSRGRFVLVQQLILEIQRPTEKGGGVKSIGIALLVEPQNRAQVPEPGQGQVVYIQMLNRLCQKIRTAHRFLNSRGTERIDSEPGAQMQTDFGEIDAMPAGEPMRVHSLVAVSRLLSPCLCQGIRA